MPAPIDNNYAQKWKTPEERKVACKQVCEHLSNGLSKKAFPYADWDTVESYIKNFPEDFPTEKIAEAERLGRLYWEKLGMQGMMGIDVTITDQTGAKTKQSFKNFQPSMWIFNMKNRFGWRDRVDVTSDDDKLDTPIIMKPQKYEVEKPADVSGQ